MLVNYLKVLWLHIIILLGCMIAIQCYEDEEDTILEDRLIYSRNFPNNIVYNFSLDLSSDDVFDIMIAFAELYDNVGIINLGYTSINSPLFGFYLAGNLPQNATDFNKIIVITGSFMGTKFTTTTALALITLLTSDTIDANIKNGVDYFIIPIMNIDAYDMDIDNGKNYQKMVGHEYIGACRGVLIKYNFDYYFDKNERSDPCDKHYAGIVPFNSNEARYFKHYLHLLSGRIMALITLDANSKPFISYPWGADNNVYPANWKILNELAMGTVMKMNSKYHIDYAYGHHKNIYRTTYGFVNDYVYDKGVPFVFNINSYMPGRRYKSEHVEQSADVILDLLERITKQPNDTYTLGPKMSKSPDQ